MDTPLVSSAELARLSDELGEHIEQLYGSVEELATVEIENMEPIVRNIIARCAELKTTIRTMLKLKPQQVPVPESSATAQSETKGEVTMSDDKPADAMPEAEPEAPAAEPAPEPQAEPVA